MCHLFLIWTPSATHQNTIMILALESLEVCASLVGPGQTSRERLTVCAHMALAVIRTLTWSFWKSRSPQKSKKPHSVFVCTQLRSRKSGVPLTGCACLRSLTTAYFLWYIGSKAQHLLWAFLYKKRCCNTTFTLVTSFQKCLLIMQLTLFLKVLSLNTQDNVILNSFIFTMLCILWNRFKNPVIQNNSILCNSNLTGISVS